MASLRGRKARRERREHAVETALLGLQAFENAAELAFSQLGAAELLIQLFDQAGAYPAGSTVPAPELGRCGERQVLGIARDATRWALAGSERRGLRGARPCHSSVLAVVRAVEPPGQTQGVRSSASFAPTGACSGSCEPHNLSARRVGCVSAGTDGERHEPCIPVEHLHSAARKGPMHLGLEKDHVFEILHPSIAGARCGSHDHGCRLRKATFVARQPSRPS